jgi:hypothetical protein
MAAALTGATIGPRTLETPMFHCMKIWSLLAVLAGGLWLGSGTANACPMCNQSIAEENALPRAYMYSILFMLGMPATVFTGFGVLLYRQVRAHDAAQAALIPDHAPFQAGAEPPAVGQLALDV